MTTRERVRAVAGTVALALLVAGIVIPRAFGDSPNYQFTNLSPRFADDGSLHIDYTVSWHGNQFPGDRECTFSVFAEDGSLIDTATAEYTDVDPHPRDATFEIRSPIEQGTKPDHVDASCSQIRLDDPTGHYVFDNVRVERDNYMTTDQRSFEMVYDDRWVGAGEPTTLACSLSARGKTGAPLFTWDFNFNDPAGVSTDHELPIVLDSPEPVDPIAARVSCTPL